MKRRERNKGQARAEAVQIRESGRHPFGVLDRYVPLGAGELQLYGPSGRRCPSWTRPSGS